ncbi:hypothetical protein OIE66_30645 [Nonomuraea sp. NBC_01738]|uniref:hypothetical protein n=1 Tax=Nonomuraea sp. NBC_01738 TaxID=2976003 RepID=UPI002E0E0369|nr:hypothetical protein OIE66_30645 [Nonomuraea sp. NBC_01738]
MNTTLARAIAAILDALDTHDLTTARRLFNRAIRDDPPALSDLVRGLAAAVSIPETMIVVGSGIDLWNNPHRGDSYAWRCGDCRMIGTNYRTMPAARSAAEKHATDHQVGTKPGPTVAEYSSDRHTQSAQP